MITSAIKEEIHRLYREEELTIREVGQRLKLCYQTVQRNLKARSLSEAQCNRYKHRPKMPWKPRQILKSGYVKIYQGIRQYEYEHRLIWEEYHQKKLPDGWVVHHLNGIRGDNRPENLIAMPKGKHRDILPQMAQRIRKLEIENRQLQRALEQNQSIFYIQEN